MGTKKGIEQQIFDLQKVNNSSSEINQKLDELISLLSSTELDSDTIQSLQEKFNTAVDNTPQQKESLKAFRQLDNPDLSREEILDNLSLLLTTHPVDSNISNAYIKKSLLSKVVLALIAATMIVLGMGMIIMPAPPYFEMFTLFYFTPDDGVTLMDVIALLIVLCGVYILINVFKNNKNGKRTR
ncbi:hypothetical protein SAMN05421788_104389 [Filimonas lacunae]|uniref:Uncharacterized protein n=1 Tax=Filimonas lacunae TaxID=477680 RepID=A0A173MS12_9BACT|nr:hypothetical protein [Filimonas lacunae]BAV10240.1 hypothetical protein FLA_6301 [Filimonas lacunae]SIT17917.1 hypothetical protein SAMN05421788_104389 [Filimonas lacunae]